MTSQDFTAWLSFHEKHFPGFQDWFLGMSPHAPGAEVDAREAAWFSAFGSFGSPSVRDATVALAKTPPATFADHLDAMRKLLRKPKRNDPKSSSRYANACGLCNETGLVYALSRSGFQTTKRGLPAREAYLTVACLCAQGQPLSSREKDPYPKFDRDTMQSIGEWREAFYAEFQTRQQGSAA